MVNAVILSYVGHKSAVYVLLQGLSHKARAFCVKQRGLKGFLTNKPMEQKTWNVCVPLKNPWKFNLPLSRNLPSSFVNATILSYYGSRADVCALLQSMNHESRAYFGHLDSLRIFLINLPYGYDHFGQYTRNVFIQL